MILFIASFAVSAQEYCEVSYTNDIEPITRIVFAGIDNTTSPEINGTPGYEYFEDELGLFDPVAGGTIIIEGNTNGNYTNTFTVFIDWNENGDFTDPGEMYFAGLLINSTGNDGQQTITEIIAPNGTDIAETRIRIIKHRTSSETPIWPTDPCGIYEFGQTEDYPLLVNPVDPPPPYCEVSYTNDIEPITLVSFAGINNTTSPEINGTPGHEYFLDLTGEFVVENETHSLILQGNTNGNHTNTFTIFIDWNENGDFTDPGEMYFAGSVSNSTGTDGQQAVTEITIPFEVAGIKRLRVIKHRTSTETPEWPEDPCGVYEYGQAEDYILEVLPFDPPPPYCEVSYTNDIEPITFVSFAGINNTTSPVINGTPGHEYFDEDNTLFGNLDEEATYTINLQGNTNGNHTNTFTVFIDWNENGDFTNPGEMYFAGSVTNSTGTDEQYAGTDITAPYASTGTKRMRIIKHRTSTETPEWPEDPCGVYEYGQAEDYTLIVTHPDFFCESEYLGDLTGGLGNLQTIRYAADYSIGIEPEPVYIKELVLKVFNEISTADIYIYKDDEGKPGELLGSRTQVTPAFQEWVGNELGFDVYLISLMFEPIGSGNTGEIHWVALETAAASGNLPNFWETAVETTNSVAYFSTDGGNSWTADTESRDAAFWIYGICGEMDTNDFSGGYDFNYYPNPVNDVLKIHSSEKIKQLTVFDASGVEKLNFFPPANAEVNLSLLPPNLYFIRVLLENGAIETFKIIKK